MTVRTKRGSLVRVGFLAIVLLAGLIGWGPAGLTTQERVTIPEPKVPGILIQTLPIKPAPCCAELWIHDSDIVKTGGSLVRIMGSGFPENTVVFLFVWETFWSSVKTNAYGAFNATLTVPSLPADVYTVRAGIGEVTWATHPLIIIHVT